MHHIASPCSSVTLCLLLSSAPYIRNTSASSTSLLLVWRSATFSAIAVAVYRSLYALPNPGLADREARYFAQRLFHLRDDLSQEPTRTTRDETPTRNLLTPRHQSRQVRTVLHGRGTAGRQEQTRGDVFVHNLEDSQKPACNFLNQLARFHRIIHHSFGICD